MATTITITTNASQATDVVIKDMGIVIGSSGGSATFTDYGNLQDARNSTYLRDLSTDNAFGAGSSTLIISRSGNTINQSEIDVFLSELNGVSTVYWGALSANPTTTPLNGDTYFNTSLEMQMIYDSSRTKWLSSESATLIFGRNGNTGANSYYRLLDSLSSSATAGWDAHFNGTVVSLSYTRSDSDAATFEVTAGGTTVSSLASAATQGRTTTLNNDFSQGAILACRNASGSNTTTDAQILVRIKWRP